MSYRNALPQLGTDLFLADGGLETTLIFHDGLDLPDFAAFHLLQTAEGTEAIRRYFRAYAQLASRLGVGFLAESATWRANPDWGRRLGYSREQLAAANRTAVGLAEEIRHEFASQATPVVISGVVGPRGDGYVAGDLMSAGEAEEYHGEQIETFAGTSADMIGAITMTYVDEAVGVARAAERVGMPVALSFTVETDGTTPGGQPLGEAIENVDAATSGYPAYYMINCAHTSHFSGALDPDQPWVGRIRGLRANASRRSHAELDEAPDLDIGDRAELAADYAELRRRLDNLTVMGGCCGTDHRHIEEIALACLPLFRSRT